MMKDYVLKTQHVTKCFRSGSKMITVLKDISFSVARSDSWAIVGPSGSGKTTLLGLCAGLDMADGGYIELVGENLHDLTEDQRAILRKKKVGFIFQNFHLLPSLTALENVMIPLELEGVSRTIAYKKAVEMLTEVGLEDRIKHLPNQLSGGEQQRVAVARAFIHSPEILFADEPTGNLDGETSEKIENLLFDMNIKTKTTLILVTHNTILAKRCNHILTLHQGKIVPSESTVIV